MLIRVGTTFEGYRDIFSILYCWQWLYLLFQLENGNYFLLFSVKIKEINPVIR